MWAYHKGVSEEMGNTSVNPFLVRAAKKKLQSPAYHHAPKQEYVAAKRIKGYTISGSGSGKTKGDARLPGVIRVEAKATSKASFRVTREMIEKIEAAALGCDEIPVIEIDMLDAKGKVEHRMVVLPASEFYRMLDDVTSG